MADRDSGARRALPGEGTGMSGVEELAEQLAVAVKALEEVGRRLEALPDFGIMHMVEEGPNARWVEYESDPPDGYFEEDLVCRADCPACAAQKQVAEARAVLTAALEPA